MDDDAPAEPASDAEAQDGAAPDERPSDGAAAAEGAPVPEPVAAEEPAADADADGAPDEDDAAAVAGTTGRLAAVAGAARRIRALDQDDRFVDAARRLRDRLPGDSRFGDPLSTAPSHERRPAAQTLARIAGQPRGVSHEVGLGALQLFQAAAESRNRGRGQTELAILFTDLVGFSEWAMEAGDDAALGLLRDVAKVLEPAVRAEHGDVVKWLGDGMMAVFRSAPDAVAAVARAQRGLEDVERDGHRPRMRAGVHVGRPKRVGRDYLGVDVNVAARVADAASAGELFVSDQALAGLGSDARSRRRRRFHAKGVPAEIGVHLLLQD